MDHNHAHMDHMDQMDHSLHDAHAGHGHGMFNKKFTTFQLKISTIILKFNIEMVPDHSTHGQAGHNHGEHGDHGEHGSMHHMMMMTVSENVQCAPTLFHHLISFFSYFTHTVSFRL